MSDRIEVTTPGVKEKFTEWIDARGGVQVWENVNLSNPNAGRIFTPAQTDGKPTPAPCWTHNKGELVTDIQRFRFCVEEREMQRLKIGLQQRGMKIELTTASSRKLKAAMAKIQEQRGTAPCYHARQLSRCPCLRIDHMKIYKRIVRGSILVTAITQLLIERSCWFSIEPLPDNEWEIQVKGGEGLEEIVDSVIPATMIRKAD